MELHPHVEVARALVRCLLEGDAAGVDALYDEDIRVWRNFDGREMDKRQALGVVRFLTTEVDDLDYQEVRVQPTPDGFVQQHVLTGVSKAGTPVRAAACMVAQVAAGRIRRIDEYLDAASLAPLLGKR